METSEQYNNSRLTELLMDIEYEDDDNYTGEKLTVQQRNRKSRLKGQIEQFGHDKSNKKFVELMVRALEELDKPNQLMEKNRRLATKMRKMEKDREQENYFYTSEDKKKVRDEMKAHFDKEHEDLLGFRQRSIERARKQSNNLEKLQGVIDGYRNNYHMTPNKEWSEQCERDARTQIAFKEMKDQLAGYQNSKLDPKLQKKYKQAKKTIKQLQKEILELKLKLNDDEATSSSSSESDSE